MSAPVSATITSADRSPIPGMVSMRLQKERNGSITTSIRVIKSAICRLRWSIASKYMLAKKAWWSLNRPVSASVKSAILVRGRLLASSASAGRVALARSQKRRRSSFQPIRFLPLYFARIHPTIRQAWLSRWWNAREDTPCRKLGTARPPTAPPSPRNGRTAGRGWSPPSRPPPPASECFSYTS
jgi:hypothetical protein